MQAYIKAISYYLPEEILTNEKLSELFPEWSIEKIVGKIGINTRHIAGERETASDMAFKASQRLFKEWNILPQDIDFIILCTQSPDYYLPTTACILQNSLNIPTSAGALDINLGCSGYVYGLALAKGLIASGVAHNILFITSELYTRRIHPKDKANRSIFGDAATATLVANEGFAEIGDFVLGTDGSGSENLMIKTGGMKFQDKQKEERLENSIFYSSDHIFMNGPEIFTFTINRIPKLVQDTLLKNGLQEIDINLYVFHQANKYMMDYLRRKMKVDEDRFYYYLSEVGNTVSSTIPIALNEAYKNQKLKGNVMIAGFGVGYSWAATILKIKK